MNSLNHTALPEAIACVALGLRDAISRKLILFSIGLWFGAVALWCVILFFAWSWIKAFAGMLAAWTLLGIFSIFPNWLPASAQAKLTGVSLPVGAEALLGPVFHVVSWLVFILLIVACVIITVRIVLEFLLMPLIRGEVLRSYPPFPAHATSSLLIPLKNAAKTALLVIMIGVPCLLIPIANVVLLFILFGYLNVRTLVNEALDGLASPEEQRRVIQAARWRMVLVGVLIAGALTVPFVGFVAASWTGASTCHLCLRTLLKLRADNTARQTVP